METASKSQKPLNKDNSTSEKRQQTQSQSLQKRNYFGINVFHGMGDWIPIEIPTCHV